MFAETEMTIAFEARSVICSEALGGDILQVTFDSVIDGDEECRGQRGRCCFSDLRSFLAVCSAFGAGKAGPKNHEVSDAKSPPAPGPRGFC